MPPQLTNECHAKSINNCKKKKCVRQLVRCSHANQVTEKRKGIRQMLHGSHVGSDAMSTKIVKKFDS